MSVPETLKALQLVVNAAESKIMTYMSCNSNREGVEDVSTEPSLLASENRPMVAKSLRSKSDNAAFEQDDTKVDPRELEVDSLNDYKLFQETPLPRTLGLPHKQKLGEGFVPAWRRKSLDNINRMKNERRGEVV
jgi:hypothetical protein